MFGLGLGLKFVICIHKAFPFIGIGHNTRFHISGAENKAVEVGVLQSLGGGDAFLRVENHHFHHQVNSLLGGVGYQLLQGGRHKFGERKTNFGSKLVPLRPLDLSWTAKDCTSFVDLISFIVAWEKRSHQVELSHDGSSSKDIDRGVIVGAPE